MENKENCNPCQKMEEQCDPANGIQLDIAIYAGPMNSRQSKQFLKWCSEERPDNRGCVIILSTLGGFAGDAYRIARALQRNFKKVCIAIPWVCKSAGTLLCIGANALMFGKNGELGPLDVQIPKKDELFDFSSGLTPLHALEVLREQSFSYFEEAFLAIVQKSGGQISTTKAARIAIKLTVGLFGQIYTQIDPQQLGKTTRDMNVAQAYGERLNAVSRNLKHGALGRLLLHYPEHGFVIDGTEAETLFNNVYPMSPEISKISDDYLSDIKLALIKEKAFFCVITDRHFEKEGQSPSSLPKQCNSSSSEEDLLNTSQQEKNVVTPEISNFTEDDQKGE